MVTRNEIIDLLTLATVYDQRNADEADVQGWLAVAEMENWTAPAARRVVIEHYSRGAERPRINPAAITDRLRDAQRKAANSFVDPDALEGESGREYVERRRRLMREHIAQVMDAWATKGEPIPEAASVAELRGVGTGLLALPAGIDASTCPPELRDQLARDLARAGQMDRLPRPPAEPVRRVKADDPERRAQARAELAALNDAGDEDTSTQDGAA